MFKGGFPMPSAFLMSCYDVTDNSSHINGDLSIGCDS